MAVVSIGCIQTPPAPARTKGSVPVQTGEPSAPPFMDRGSDGNWSYLIEKLTVDGVPRDRIEHVFFDDRLPAFDLLDYSLKPGESHAMYRGFQAPSRVDAARACHDEHADAFDKAQEQYGVPGGVVAAIVFVESGCGVNTGRSMIFYRLARLAMANEPRNVERNIRRLAVTDGVFDQDKADLARRRAKYLEDTFYPEVQALFEIARRTRIDPLAMRGSPSGAFGYPQFLPSSYLKYGVDGNGDGKVSLYDMNDAIASAANYFKQKGWRLGLTDEERRRVVWEYNRSTPYIDTILSLAEQIDSAALARQ